MRLLLQNGFRRWPLALCLAGLLALAGGAGCDIGSADSTTAIPSDNAGNRYDFSGLYLHPSARDPAALTPLVYPEGGQSGATLTWMRLIQYGSVLEGYDNANQNWTGKISSLDGSTASFSLRGRTTAGRTVEVIGTMTYSSDREHRARMDAAWIEFGFSGSLIAQAVVIPPSPIAPENGNGEDEVEDEVDPEDDSHDDNDDDNDPDDNNDNGNGDNDNGDNGDENGNGDNGNGNGSNGNGGYNPPPTPGQ